MADYAMIDTYLGELRREVGRLAQAEAILDEVADHLLEALSASIRLGFGPVEAETRVLAEFGDPRVVGRAFASATTGGIAVPTDFTRRSGVSLIVSSFLWLVGFALLYASNVMDRTRPWEGTPQTLWTIGAGLLVLAAGSLLLGIIGLTRRHGGMGGPGRVAIGLGVLLVPAALIPWAAVVWSTLLALIGVMVAAGLSRAAMAPKAAGTLIATGAVAVSTLFWCAEFIATGDDALTGWVVPALFIAFGVFAAGLGTVGMWLRREKAVADDPGRAAVA